MANATSLNNNNADDDFSTFIVTDAPDQRVIDGVQVPLILTPPPSTNNNNSLFQTPSDVAAWRTLIHSLWMPLLLLTTTTTTNNNNSNWQDLSYEKSMSFAVRKRCADRICTTNEGKSGGLVFHHEQAQTPLWPSHVFFCCQLPAQPGHGGATGLTPSYVVYERLKEKYPAFVQDCESKGVRYTFYAGPEQDTSKGAGRSWKSFFHVNTRQECEEKMKAGGWDFSWGVDPPGRSSSSSSSSSVPAGEDFLKCTTPILDAVKVAPGTDKKCFFNQLIATTANALEFSKVGMQGGGYDPLKDVPTQEAIDACIAFGDGSQISLDILLDAKQICEELAVDVDWKQGDVALISNYLMMHARRPWTGPEGTRKLLASLVAEQNCTSFGKPLVV